MQIQAKGLVGCNIAIPKIEYSNIECYSAK